MNFKILFSVITVVILVFIISLVAIQMGNKKAASITNFDECAAAGYPIMESYPEQCKTPDGRTFTKVVDGVPAAQFNTPVTLTANKTISFTDGLQLELVKINDSRCKPGLVCVWAGELSTQLTASGGGLGQNPQEFNLGMTTTRTAGAGAYLFTLNGTTETTATVTVQTEESKAGCFVGGCSSQICSDQPNAVSTCEYREEYACYKTAKCARQQNGQCGWTQTVELTSCLQGK